MVAHSGNRRNHSLLDQIAQFLAEKPHGVLCTEIARRFLRMSDPSAAQAVVVVSALLGEDCRFIELGRGLWTAGEGELPADSEISAKRENEVLLFGAARRSADGSTSSIGLIRVEGGEAIEDSYVQRLADPRCASPDAASLAEHAQIILFSAAGPFRFSQGASPFRLRWWAEKLFPGRSFQVIGDLAAYLGHPFLDDESALGDARLTRDLYERLRESHGAPAPSDGLGTPPGEIPFLREGGDTMLGELPESPGVYRMRNGAGDLLYVGKSRSLRSRLENWFHGFRNLPETKQKMICEVVKIDIEQVGSDLEALLLEERAIRRENPQWNEQREVHTGNSGGRRMADRVLFLPAVDERFITLLLIRTDGAVCPYRLRRGTRKSTALGKKLCRFFVDRSGTPTRQAHTIAERWLHANRNSVTALDPSVYASMEELTAAVLACLGEPGITGGQRFDMLPPSID